MAIVIAVLVCSCVPSQYENKKNITSTPSLSQEEIAAFNIDMAESKIDELYIYVALLEGDAGKNGAYDDGGGTYIGSYGLSHNGSGKLKKGDIVSQSRAKELVYAHFRKNIFPYVAFVKHPMSEGEMIVFSLFTYMVGGTGCTGLYIDGSKAPNKPSRFFEALNEGADLDQLISYTTAIRKVGGKRANGMLKRHWVTGAIAKGLITKDDVLSLRPVYFYNAKLKDYYYYDESNKLKVFEACYYIPRYDKEVCDIFLDKNIAKKGQTSVSKIM